LSKKAINSVGYTDSYSVISADLTDQISTVNVECTAESNFACHY